MAKLDDTSDYGDLGCDREAGEEGTEGAEELANDCAPFALAADSDRER